MLYYAFFDARGFDVLIPWQCKLLQAFLSGVGEAVAAHSTAAEKCESVAQLPSAGVPVQLCDLADGSLARAAGAQVPPIIDSSMHACKRVKGLNHRHVA